MRSLGSMASRHSASMIRYSALGKVGTAWPSTMRVFQPLWSAWRCVLTHDVDLLRRDAERCELRHQRALFDRARLPPPAAWFVADARLQEDRLALGPDEQRVEPQR